MNATTSSDQDFTISSFSSSHLQISLMHFSTANQKLRMSTLLLHKKLVCYQNFEAMSSRNAAYHDAENPNKNCNKICEEMQGMFHVVQLPKVSSLYNLLSVKDDVSQEDQQPKVKLQKKKSTSSNLAITNIEILVRFGLSRLPQPSISPHCVQKWILPTATTEG